MAREPRIQGDQESSDLRGLEYRWNEGGQNFLCSF